MPRKSRRRLANRWVFSTQPLLDHFGPDANNKDIAHQLGINESTIGIWRTKPALLDTHAADRYAIRIGQHPAMIWDDWFDLPEYTPERAKEILGIS